MQKIEIEFKNQTLKIYLIVKEKNLDNTLLNTNIISNEKLLFSLDYIEKNQKLVSSFLKEICLEKGIKKVAMPTIGAGLDRLNWKDVSKQINSIFADTDIEILVCKKVI